MRKNIKIFMGTAGAPQADSPEIKIPALCAITGKTA